MTQVTPRRWWLAILAIVAVFLLVSVGVNAATSGSYNDEVAGANARAHFWRTIAGRDHQSDATVDGKLANDIRRWFRDPVAQHPAGSFRGDSNDYGGITDALHGYDPFDESCGPECGHLSNDAMDKTELALGGQVDEVVAADKPKRGAEMPTKLIAALLAGWLVFGAAMVLMPIWRRQQRQDAVGHAYPDEYRLIRQLTESARALPASDPNKRQLENLSSGLSKALSKRMMAGDSDVRNERIRELVHEATGALEAFDEGNRAIES